MATKTSENCSECHDSFCAVRHGKKFKLCDDCYRQNVKDRLAGRKIKRSLPEGCLIVYYESGWRVGYLVKLKTSAAVVQPLGTRTGGVPECVVVPLTDIKADKISSAKAPATVQEYYEMNEKKKVLLIADKTSAAATKAIEYLMNHPVEHTLSAAKVKDIGITTTAGHFVLAVLGEERSTKEVSKRSAASEKGEQVAKSRTKHAPVDLLKVREMYESGTSVNDIVEAVRSTRAAFDVKKLVRKTLKELGLLK